MKIITTFAIVAIFAIGTQVANAQANYKDYSKSKKKAILSEDFKNNKNGWLLLDNENELIEIKDGNYIYESKDGQAKANYITVPINQSSDFEIEMRIKYIQGEDNNSNGLVWGCDNDRTNRFLYAFSGDGSYCVAEFDPAVFLVKWTNSSLINTSDYMLLTVRKVDQKYYFFLNQKLVETLTFRSFYGDKIGIHCNRNTRIMVDYLKVFNLKK